MVTSIRGTQAVSRALGVLRQISNHHPAGINIGEIASAEGLDRATAYRLASCLVVSGLVTKDAAKRYRLGAEATSLGLSSMRQAPIIGHVQPVMRRLARRTEDTVFLVVRSGDYGHCLHYEQGAYPVKAMVMHVGGMRALGLGSASLTLLSRQSSTEVEALYARRVDEFKSYELSLYKLNQLLSKTRKDGFASTQGLITKGVSGVGVGFELRSGSYGAISIAAITSRMPEQRRDWMVQLIIEELTTTGFQPFRVEA